MRGSAKYSTGVAILTRIQEIIKAGRGPLSGGQSVEVYRDGGPLNAAGTSVWISQVEPDREHGSLTNGAIWYYCAKSARPTATPAQLRNPATYDAATRNVLDKIEQSLLERRLHITAARAICWIIENSRDPSVTWQSFIDSRSVDIASEGFVGYPLRQKLDWPDSAVGFYILPRATPALVNGVFSVKVERCLGSFASISSDELQRAIRNAVPAGIGSFVGTNARITRELASISASCNDLVRAQWAFETNIPSAQEFVGSQQRFSASLTQMISQNISNSAEYEINVKPFDPAINGSLAAWRSGTVAATATRDEYRVGVSENPDGPNELRPSTPNTVMDAAQLLAGTAVTLGGLYLLVQLIPVAREGVSAYRETRTASGGGDG